MYEQSGDEYPDHEFREVLGEPPRRGLSKGTIALIAAGVLMVVAAVAICLPLLTGGSAATTGGSATTSRSSTAGPSSTPSGRTFDTALAAGTAFLSAWQAGAYTDLQHLVTPGTPNLERVYGGMDKRLGVTKRVITPGAVNQYSSLDYTATLTLKGLGDLRYQGSVGLVQKAAGWSVDWNAEAVYPGLAAGQRLDLSSGDGNRGDIQDRKGRPLSSDPQLAGKVVGDASGGGGKSGLQRVQDDNLQGAPSRDVVIAQQPGGDVVKVLMSVGGSKGKPVRTTLDLDLQAAAEAALSGVTSRAGLVAMDTRTGQVRALADVNGGGLPASLLAQEPPGSTFKIVTATAALMNGASPSSKVPCTTTLSVNGKTFHNYEANPTKTMSLTEAFADSCNTAFIHLEQGLPDGALLQAADLYGFGIDKPLPVGSEGGHLPAPAGSVEAAADAIGQGRVLASPLQLASVAAGVASGTWHQPRLLADCPDCAQHAIPNASALRTMMRAVVTSGTGTVMAKTPGGKVYAKTGTAEFGSGDSLHAWFVGWQGNIAFAAYVENGKTGGTTAAPLVKKFLTRLAG